MKTESRKCNDNVLGDRGNKMNWKSIKKKYPKAFKLLDKTVDIFFIPNCCSMDEPDYCEPYKTKHRTEAEEQAFLKAFEILEEKMNDIKKEEELWLWIEQKLIEARIDEQRRNIGMFLSLPDSEFTDLQIQSILLNRISELEK